MTTPRKRSAGAARFRGDPRRRLLPAALAALALLAGCSTGDGQVDVTNGGEFRFVQGTPAGEVIPEDERAPAPDFGGTLLGGGAWCAPCRVEAPQFQEVYADVRDEGVAFLGLNVKEADEQFGQAFVDTQGIEFPSLYDPAGEVALTFRDYPANAIPSTIVLDREGRVAAVYTGEVSQDDLRAVIDLLLGEG
jgi:thiol-disulfide isomerase/thioredoxin